MSGETSRATLVRRGVRWRRAKEWITSPDPEYARKKARRDRLITCYLPITSPWLNPIEPKWLAGKKRVAEPARLLSAPELEDRVCAAFGCPREPHLLQPPPLTPKSKKAA